MSTILGAYFLLDEQREYREFLRLSIYQYVVEQLLAIDHTRFAQWFRYVFWCQALSSYLPTLFD
jgi:hypothetical protein